MAVELEPLRDLMPMECGPRKRLLPGLARGFSEGNVLHVDRTGESMLVLRNDERGVLVERAIGAVGAQPLRKGDCILRVALGPPLGASYP